MTAHLRFFGTTTLRLSGPRWAVAEMARLWQPFVVPTGPEDAPEVAVTDPATASAAVNRLVVSACPHPAVHAGVVVLGGRAVAVPAASGEGKSTLVAALCRRGWGYVSDEALVVAADGRALPYPKPLALAPDSLAALGLAERVAGPEAARRTEHLLAPDELGPVGEAPAVVTDIVLPRRGEGSDLAPARVEPVHRRQALARLVELGFNHYRDPPGFLRAMAAVVTSSRVWVTRYREASDAAGALIDTIPDPVSSA